MLFRSETVYSQRKWSVRGGNTVDGEPPVYDWLIGEEETEPEASPDTVPEPESDTAPADTGSPDGSLPDVTDGEETTAKEKGCRSTLSAWISLLVTGAALLLSKKREIFSRT